MKKKIIYLFVPLLLLIISSNIKTARAEDDPERHYKIELTRQEDGSLRVNNYNIIVSLGAVVSLEEKQEYLAELYSLDDKKLLQSYFAIPKEGDYFLEMQYKPNGKEIKILSGDSGEELLNINVQVFAKVCGDKECQAHESYENCLEDCPSGGADDYCDHRGDGICDPDCENIKDADTDCTGENPAVIQAELKKKLGLEDDKKIEAGTKKGIFESFSRIKNLTIFIVLAAAIVSIIIFFFIKMRGKRNAGSN